MRILIVTGKYPPLKCGIGVYTRELSKSLSLKGNLVSILSTFSKQKPKNFPMYCNALLLAIIFLYIIL